MMRCKLPIPNDPQQYEGWKEKISESMKGRNSGSDNPFFGKKHSTETIEKIRQAALMRKFSKEQIDFRNEQVRIANQSPKLREKRREITSALWKDKNYAKSVLHRRKMSSLEKKFHDIINRCNLPYKFVGNGEFTIGRKNPDFVNCNGEKIAIEVYYRKHKEQFRNGLENWKQKRASVFNEYGWRLIFFDETEVNEEGINNKLRGD